jgi:hypothetical protein
MFRTMASTQARLWPVLAAEAAEMPERAQQRLLHDIVGVVGARTR